VLLTIAAFAAARLSVTAAQAAQGPSVTGPCPSATAANTRLGAAVVEDITVQVPGQFNPVGSTWCPLVTQLP
jgi:hypothetical protein